MSYCDDCGLTSCYIRGAGCSRSSKYTGGPTRSPGMMIVINFQESTDECRLVLHDGKASREVKRLDATGCAAWVPYTSQLHRENNNQVILARALQSAVFNPGDLGITMTSAHVNIGKVS